MSDAAHDLHASPTGVTPLRNARSNTKQQLTSAAYHVITRRGALRLSMQEIADEAHVSKGLIHYHFRNKAHLISDALEWAIRATADRIRNTMAQPAYRGDPLTALVDAIFIDPHANHSFYLAYIDMVEHVGREDSFQEFSAMTREVIEGLYADVVRSGNETGQFDRHDIDDAARDVRIVVDGLFVRWLQVTDWAAAHADYKLHCRRLLGVVLRESSG